MELTRLIQHPELLNKETLYDLRALLALYPYYQTARLLMLQNLYLLHDASFDEELRRAAIYITDRRVIFQMIEAAHYQMKRVAKPKEQAEGEDGNSRTVALIDSFLDTIPAEAQEAKPKRKPTPADAAVDYVAYLLETESGDEESEPAPKMKGQNLIDDFIKDGKFNLNTMEDTDRPLEFMPEIEPSMDEEEETPNNAYFTETLARIYIKQGKYEKALEIISRLNLNNPKKSVYFADQMRFLEKLILNNKNNKH